MLVHAAGFALTTTNTGAFATPAEFHLFCGLSFFSHVMLPLIGADAVFQVQYPVQLSWL